MIDLYIPCLSQEKLPLPPTEILKTWADISTSTALLEFNPKTDLKTGKWIFLVVMFKIANENVSFIVDVPVCIMHISLQVSRILQNGTLTTGNWGKNKKNWTNLLIQKFGSHSKNQLVLLRLPRVASYTLIVYFVVIKL